MKKLLAILLSLVVVFGCEDKDKEEQPCDCHPVAGDMADAGSDDSDMGLDAGAEEDQGGEEAGAEDAGLDGGLDASGEEAPDAGEDCECEGEDCGC
jgi:hypothetical protein